MLFFEPLTAKATSVLAGLLSGLRAAHKPGGLKNLFSLCGSSLRSAIFLRLPGGCLLQDHPGGLCRQRTGHRTFLLRLFFFIKVKCMPAFSPSSVTAAFPTNALMSYSNLCRDRIFLQTQSSFSP